MTRLLALVALLAMPLALSGCFYNPRVDVREPTSVRPPAAPVAAPAPNGSIFQTASYRPLFEDRRARFVGDTLIIALNEKLNASKKNNSSADRNGSMAVSIPTIQGFPGKTFQGAAIDANSANKFEGKGATGAENLFTGTITVTVIDVLANGNLVVSGEKQIGISKNTETLRFSGVVNPANILPSNTVSSTQVADARIDYHGDGYIDEAQMMGWLARFFLTFMPF